MNSEIRADLTEPDESLHKNERNEYKLTPRQQMAAELMATGKSKTATAEEVGISRQQLWEWEKNVYFKSAVSKIHADLWVENVQRLRGLGARAVDVIEREIDGGNVKAAIALLKTIGMSSGKIALQRKGKTVEDFLAIEAEKEADAIIASWPAEDPMQQLTYMVKAKPQIVKDKVQNMLKDIEPPEDTL